MIEQLIDTLGLPALVLIIVGVALLIVVILLMSYFKVLLSITRFTYPNSKLRALGNPFVKKKKIDSVIESSSFNEMLSKLRDNDYDLPKESGGEDISEIEMKLEENLIGSIKSVYRTVPTEVKPFVNTWLMKYDLKMVKRALKAKSRGLDEEELDKKLIPVKMIDERVLEDIKSARDKQELISILSEAGFDEVLQDIEKDDNYFKIDIALDKYILEELKRAVTKIGSEEKTSIRHFFGNYTDILNLKIIFRGLREGADEETLKSALLPSGRELEDWKLENMIEAGSIDEALIELEGSEYENLKDVRSANSDFELEKRLDEKLLNFVSNIYSQEILTVGPLLKFLIAKDMELRNLKILVKGVQEGMSAERISDLMIMEGLG